MCNGLLFTSLCPFSATDLDMLIEHPIFIMEKHPSTTPYWTPFKTEYVEKQLKTRTQYCGICGEGQR